MKSAEIRQYFDELNDELRVQDVKGEICMYGGAVMCLAYQTRPATKDVDAIFEPVKQIRNAAQRVAENHGLEKEWPNSAVKMFLVPHEREVLIDLSHLKIYMPSAEYLLAMKALAARANTSDRVDIEYLVAKLELSEVAQAIAIVEKYYPHKQIKPPTQFLLEEIFEQRS